MVVTLYHFAPSAPSRGALLSAKLANVDCDVIEINLFQKEQLKPEFLKINPQHCIPTLVDDDLVLWDSHAIACYLASNYAKDERIYPNDVKQRAIIDQRLYFDCTVMYSRIRSIIFPVLFLGEDTIEEEKKINLEEALGFLDVFIGENNFTCGNNLTIADCSLAASISTLVAIGWNISPYQNVSKWFAKCSLEIPDYYLANQVGAEEIAKIFLSKLAPGQI